MSFLDKLEMYEGYDDSWETRSLLITAYENAIEAHDYQQASRIQQEIEHTDRLLTPNEKREKMDYLELPKFSHLATDHLTIDELRSQIDICSAQYYMERNPHRKHDLRKEVEFFIMLVQQRETAMIERDKVIQESSRTLLARRKKLQEKYKDALVAHDNKAADIVLEALRAINLQCVEALSREAKEENEIATRTVEVERLGTPGLSYRTVPELTADTPWMTFNKCRDKYVETGEREWLDRMLKFVTMTFPEKWDTWSSILSEEATNGWNGTMNYRYGAIHTSRGSVSPMHPVREYFAPVTVPVWNWIKQPLNWAFVVSEFICITMVLLIILL